MVEEYASPRTTSSNIAPELNIVELSPKQKELLYRAYSNIYSNNGVLDVSFYEGRRRLSGRFNISQGRGFLDESGNLVFQFTGKVSGESANGREFTKLLEVRVVVSPEGEVSVNSRRINRFGVPISPWTSAELKTDIFKDVDESSTFIKNFKKALSMFDISSLVRLDFRRAIEDDPRSAILTTAQLGPIYIDRLNNITVDGIPLWKYSSGLGKQEERRAPQSQGYATPTTIPPSSPEVTASSMAKATEVKRTVRGGMSSREYYEGHAWALALYLTYGDYDRLPEAVRKQLDRKTYVSYVKYYSKYGIPQGVLDNKGMEVDKLQAAIFLSLLVLGTGKLGMETIRNVVNSGIASEAEILSKLASEPQLIASAVGKKGYQAYFKGLATEDGSFEGALKVIRKAKDERAKWATAELFEQKLSVLSSPPAVQELPQTVTKPEEVQTEEAPRKAEERPTEESLEEGREVQPKVARAPEAREEPATSARPNVKRVRLETNALSRLRESVEDIQKERGAKPAVATLEQADDGSLLVAPRGALAPFRGSGFLEFLTSDENEIRAALIAVGASLEALARMYATEPMVYIVLPQGSYDVRELRNVRNVKLRIGNRDHFLIQFDDAGNARIDLAVLNTLVKNEDVKRIGSLLNALGIKPEDLVGVGDASRFEGINAEAIFQALPASALAAVILHKFGAQGAHLYIPRVVTKDGKKVRQDLLLRVSELNPFSSESYARIDVYTPSAGGVPLAVAGEEKATPEPQREAAPAETEEAPATETTPATEETETSAETTAETEEAPATETTPATEETEEETETPAETTEATEELPPEPEEVEGAEEQKAVAAEVELPQKLSDIFKRTTYDIKSMYATSPFLYALSNNLSRQFGAEVSIGPATGFAVFLTEDVMQQQGDEVAYDLIEKHLLLTYLSYLSWMGNDWSEIQKNYKDLLAYLRQKGFGSIDVEEYMKAGTYYDDLNDAVREFAEQRGLANFGSFGARSFITAVLQTFGELPEDPNTILFEIDALWQDLLPWLQKYVQKNQRE